MAEDLKAGIISSTCQVTPKEKENSLWLGKIDPSVGFVGDIMMDHVTLGIYGAMGVENWATK